MTKLQTVVELPEFQRRAKAIMTDSEREAAIVWIAENPEAGRRVPQSVGQLNLGFDAGSDFVCQPPRKSTS